MKRTNSSQSRVETDSKSIFELHFFIYLQIEFQFQFNSIFNFQSIDRSIDGFKMKPTRNQISTGPNELVTNSNVETGSIEIVYHEILIQNIKSGLRRCSIQFTIKNRSIANDQNSNFPTNSCSNSTTKWKFQSKSFQRFKVDCSPPP